MELMTLILQRLSSSVQFSSVASRVWLFATPWTAARQASLSITNSRNSLRLMSIESVMPSSHLTLCRPLLLLPPISPSIRVFSNESTFLMRWPKYWSFRPKEYYYIITTWNYYFYHYICFYFHFVCRTKKYNLRWYSYLEFSTYYFKFWWKELIYTYTQ